ncbi:MAG: Tetratricopeptide 2 repeat protein, partial [Massilia sp.]|nr:Tetratricopeptide 2 repeat protein [Massilia sp.]
MTTGYDAFISYAPADGEWVRWFAGQLREGGLRVAYQEVLRSPGAPIIDTIEEAIRNSTHGILIFSRASMTDVWVREAYFTLMRRSIEGGQRFIPVLIADVELPEFAANRFHVDLSSVDGPEYDRRVDSLVKAVRGQRPEPGVTPLLRPGSGVRPEKPRRVTLQVTAGQVKLLPEAGDAAAHAPAAVGSRLEDLQWRLAAARQRGEQPTKGPDSSGGVGALLAEFGRQLGTAFLTGAAGNALTAELAQAGQLGAALQLGLDVADELADLPWETLILPGATEPLALHPRVQVFRRTAGGTTPSMTISGPLRILVAMAAPQGPDSGPVLDLEAELAKILDSVETARRGAAGRPGAYVRILEQGTLAAIRDALVQERFHVLHISCHAAPGVLRLEDQQGRTDKVTTQRFVREGLPADRGVPLLVLSGCSTALDTTPPAGSAQATEPADDTALGGLARGLTAAGVPAVLAMTAPVTDPYATALAGSLYYELAMRDAPQVLPAFCDARRRLEEARGRLPAGTPPASLVEWATPALFLRGPSLPLYDAAEGFDEIAAPVEPQFADGVPLRKVGEFVGRHTELRTLPAALRGGGPGVLLHGIGGVGKSSLAAEVLRRLGNEAGPIVSAVSQTSPDQILDELSRTLLEAFSDDAVRQLALTIRQPQNEWSQRLQALAPLLAQLPVTLLLDNFEDNLNNDATQWTVTNPELAAFLTAWIRLRGKHTLLVTSRYPFPLPQHAERRLNTHHLGPLSWAETRKLMWRLPALDALPAADRRRAWAAVGGHPRTLEYLDAVLRGGNARFDDVRERLEELLERRGISDPGAWFRQVGGRLDSALAEAVTLAVDDTLLHELVGLLDGFTREVLVGVSVFRLPVDRVGLAWSVSTPIPPDPQRDQRLQRLDDLLRRVRGANPQAGWDDLGLPLEELGQARADVASLSGAPITEPEGMDGAVEVLMRLGLLAPASPAGTARAEGEAPLVLVHRWTAGTLARPHLTTPEHLTAAHTAAAAFWTWGVQTRPQSAEQDVVELVEARYHLHAAGDLDGAVSATDWICEKLHTWGAWAWEEQLY